MSPTLHEVELGWNIVLTQNCEFRLKMKRPPTAKMYRKHLDELYAEALAEEESVSRNVRAKL